MARRNTKPMQAAAAPAPSRSRGRKDAPAAAPGPGKELVGGPSMMDEEAEYQNFLAFQNAAANRGSASRGRRGTPLP